MTKVNNWKLMHYFVRHEDEPSAKLVMLSLASYVRENWATSVALSTLVKETGLSRNTVRKVMRQLEVDGRIYKLAGGRQNLSSTFVITEPSDYPEFVSKMYGRKDAQRVNHDSQRVKMERSEGHSLTPRRIKKIEEERIEQISPVTGDELRTKLRIARLALEEDSSSN